eukprot:jgi/Hompol1/6750/HPOL_001194-RA
MAPVKTAFQFHFYGKKPTNLIEKPEYYCRYLTKILADQSHILDDLLQPLLEEAVNELLKFDEHISKERVFATVADAKSKSCVSPILGNASLLDLWLKAEGKVAEDLLDQFMSDPQKWTLLSTLTSMEDQLIPVSADRVINQIEAAKTLIGRIPSIQHQLAYAGSVPLMVLNRYLDYIKRELHEYESEFIAVNDTNYSLQYKGQRIIQLSKCICAVHSIMTAIELWSNEPLFLALVDKLNTIDDDGAQYPSIFSAIAADYSAVLLQLSEDISSDIIVDTRESLWEYEKKTIALRPVANQLCDQIWAGVVSRGVFSYSGGCRFESDLRNGIMRILEPYTPSPASLIGKLTEGAKILSLSSDTSDSINIFELLAAVVDENTTLDTLLQQLDIYKLTAKEIRELVGRRVELLEHLSNGGSITPEQIIKMMEEVITTDEAKFKGYVIDGLPCGLNTKKKIDLEMLPLDMQILHRLLKDRGRTHIPVLVHLRISDENLVRRRAAQWYDPSTNIGYPGQQVLYSRLRRAQGWVDGQEDLVDLAETNANSKTPSKEKEGLDEAEKTDEQTGGEKDELENDDLDGDAMNADANRRPVQSAQVSAQVKLRPDVPIKNRTSWPILSEQILNRLVKKPEDGPEICEKELAEYALYEQALNELRTQHFDMLRVIDLDATVHPEVLFDQLKKTLDARNFSLFSKPIEAKRLPVPEGGLKGMPESEVLKYYSALNAEEGETRREISHFKRFCPVSFLNSGELVEADMSAAAVYRGFIYFFANDAFADRFVENPDKFLIDPLTLPQTRLSIVGAPCCGKTTQAKLVAHKYGLAYLSVDAILSKWENQSGLRKTPGSPDGMSDASKRQDTLFSKATIPFYFIDRIYSGTIPVDLLTEVVKYGVKQAEQQAKAAKGWVLDDYPRNAEQAKALVSAGLLPKYFINLQSDANTEFASNHAQNMKTDPMGHVIQDHHPDSIDLIPYYQSLCANHKDSLSELSKVLEEVESQLISIPSEQSPSTVLYQIAQAIDPFIAKAVPMGDKPEGSPEDELGVTRDYCPVTLKTSKIMTKGNKGIGAFYMNRAYYFISEEARSDFCREPHVYTTNLKIPPPRILFIGPSGSGKTTCINTLSQKWRLPHVQFRPLIVQYAHTLEKELCDEVLPLAAEDAVIPSSTLSDIFKFLFTSEPYATSGFLLEGFPRTKLELEAAIKSNYLPDVFVLLRVDAEVGAKRAMPGRKRELDQLRLKASEDAMRSNANAAMDDEDGSGSQDRKGESDESKTEGTQKFMLTDEELFEELLSSIEKDSAQHQEFIGIIENMCSVPVVEINCNQCLRPVMAILNRKLRRYLELRHGLLTSATPITVKRAELLLKLGIKYYSPIGRYCPVMLKQSNRMSANNFGKKPIIYGNQIYFVKDSAAKQVKQYTAAIVLELPLTWQSQIKKVLEEGKAVPDDLLIEAVLLMTMRVMNSGKGWVLDGFPVTFEQAAGLEKAGFLPHVFVNLTLDRDSMMQHISDARNRAYSENIERIHVLYGDTYSNWLEIDASFSKWALKQQVFSYLEAGLLRRQLYLDLKSKGKAAPISDIGLSKTHVSNNLGKFKDYCAVSFVDKNELRKSPTNKQYMAEFHEQFYCMCGAKELELFLQDPAKYTLSDKQLPTDLPVRRSRDQIKAAFPKQLELKGYCPVTFKEGPPGFSSIVLGTEECVVEYKEKLYAMQNQDQLEKFMRTPWDYMDLNLPRKLPPPQAPIPVQGLPIVGYLEQTTATSLSNALAALGQFKPKYPFKTLSDSACDFLALHLKAHNPKAKEWIRKSYTKRLETFKSKCDLLRSVTAAVMSQHEYVPPDKRLPGLDAQMDELLKLRTQ